MSTAIALGCPISHLFGSDFGHAGSTSNTGTPLLCLSCDTSLGFACSNQSTATSIPAIGPNWRIRLDFMVYPYSLLLSGAPMARQPSARAHSFHPDYQFWAELGRPLVSRDRSRAHPSGARYERASARACNKQMSTWTISIQQLKPFVGQKMRPVILAKIDRCKEALNAPE